MENNNESNSTFSLSVENDVRFLMYKEHMASTVSFAKDIVRFAFILNGAAGSALLAADKTGIMKISLVCFGIGALLATVGAAFAYLYQHSVTMSWQKSFFDYGGNECPVLRYLAFAALISSLCSFAIGGACFVYR